MATITSSGTLNIGYKGKMFAQPKCDYQLDHVIPEGESKEETALLVAAFKKLFSAGFKKLEKKRAKEIKSAMEGTEKDIEKKPPTNMEAFVATANKMIQQGVDVWRKVEVPKLAEECIAKCYAYVEKKLKKAVTKKKIKTVLKIIALVLIVVIVAAVSIAATVLTGGIAAVVIAAAIATGIGALVKTGKIILKEYNGYNGFIDKIEKDIEEIKKAIDYERKKKKAAEYRKLGPKEKVKLMMGGTKSHVKSLKKHLAAAEGRMILLRKANLQMIADAAEAETNWAKMSTHSDPSVSAEAKKAREIAGRTKHKVEKFAKKKAAFDELKKQATEQLARLEKTGEFASDKVSGVIKFARDHEDTANFLIAAVKALATSGKKIAKAMK
jgi:hypothetical protein